MSNESLPSQQPVGLLARACSLFPKPKPNLRRALIKRRWGRGLIKDRPREVGRIQVRVSRIGGERKVGLYFESRFNYNCDSEDDHGCLVALKTREFLTLGQTSHLVRAS